MRIPIKNLLTVITGGASGLGRSLTNRIIYNEGKVVSIDLKSELDAEYKFKITSSIIDRLQHFEGDVTDEGSMSKIFNSKLKRSKFDVLVNCAGSRRGFNYYSTYNVTRHACNLMKKNDLNEFGVRGSVINVVRMPLNEEEYLEEQEQYASRFNDLDELVFKLADECVTNRIRINTILVPEDSHVDSFAIMTHNLIEDQSIVGQVITIESEEESQEPMN